MPEAWRESLLGQRRQRGGGADLSGDVVTAFTDIRNHDIRFAGKQLNEALPIPVGIDGPDNTFHHDRFINNAAICMAPEADRETVCVSQSFNAAIARAACGGFHNGDGANILAGKARLMDKKSTWAWRKRLVPNWRIRLAMAVPRSFEKMAYAKARPANYRGQCAGTTE